MFKLNRNSHGIKVRPMKKNNNATRAAFASLRIAIKAYFNTYYICSRNKIIYDMCSTDADPFFELSEININALCENQEYQELYMQTIFHLHHFFELLMKDILGSVHPSLALKVVLDGNDSSEILNVLLNNGRAKIEQENTAEFNTALDRVCSLSKQSEGSVPLIVKAIIDSKTTLKDLNELRNRAWHKGVYVLRITELDQFISQNIFPLILKVFSMSLYNKLDSYWKYRNAGFDPISKIIEAGAVTPIDFKKIAFFKAYGLACYKKPVSWSFDLDDTEKKAQAIVDAIHDLGVETCFICNEKTLLVSTDSDHSVDVDGNFLGGWWNTVAAECLNCSLSIFPDVGEPSEYGVMDKVLWESGEYT